MNCNQIIVASSEAADFIKNFSNPDRLLLLCVIDRQESSVGELEELTGIRQPTLSQQLGVLRNDDIVSTRRDGKRIYYSIKNSKASILIAMLRDMFGELELEIEME